MKKKICQFSSFALALTMLLCAIPHISLTAAATAIADLADSFPSGFTAGNPAYGVWATKETDSYIAILSKTGDGTYVLSYANKAADSVAYEIIIQPSQLSLANHYIQRLKQNDVIPESTAVSFNNDQLLETHSSIHSLQPMADLSEEYKLAVKTDMQNRRGTPYSMKPIFYSYDFAESPSLDLLCTYQIRETLSYSAEELGIRHVISKGQRIATIAAKLAPSLGAPAASVAPALAKLAGGLAIAEYIVETFIAERYRGVASYSRVGSAKNTNESEIFYAVSSSKTTADYYLIKDVLSVNLMDDIAYYHSESIYFPSEDEFDCSTMIEKVRALHN